MRCEASRESIPHLHTDIKMKLNPHCAYCNSLSSHLLSVFSCLLLCARLTVICDKVL